MCKPFGVFQMSALSANWLRQALLSEYPSAFNPERTNTWGSGPEELRLLRFSRPERQTPPRVIWKIRHYLWRKRPLPFVRPLAENGDA